MLISRKMLTQNSSVTEHIVVAPIPSAGCAGPGAASPSSVLLGLTALHRPSAAVGTNDEVLKGLVRGGRGKEDWGVDTQPGGGSVLTPQPFQGVLSPSALPEELGADCVSSTGCAPGHPHSARSVTCQNDRCSFPGESGFPVPGSQSLEQGSM